MLVDLAEHQRLYEEWAARRGDTQLADGPDGNQFPDDDDEFWRSLDAAAKGTS